MIETKKGGFSQKGKWWFGLLYAASRNGIALCLALMVLLVVVDVAARTLLGSGLPGTVEINEYLLVIIGFVGIFQTHHEKGHISVGLLFDRFPEQARRVIERVNNVMILVFCMVFFYAGAERFWSAFQSGETNWFGAYVLPVWFVRLAVPVACFALCIQSLINIWQTKDNPESSCSKSGENK